VTSPLHPTILKQKRKPTTISKNINDEQRIVRNELFEEIKKREVYYFIINVNTPTLI